MTSKGDAEERKLELERKKQRLAEIREDKRRREEERRRALLRSTAAENGNLGDLPKTFSQKDLDELLEPLGISSQPQFDRLASVNKTDLCSNGGAVNGLEQPAQTPRAQNLSLAPTHVAAIAPREHAKYCKTTQTDDRISAGEFSLGSQEFDFDEEMNIIDKHLDINFDESPTREIANILPSFQFQLGNSGDISQPINEEDQKIPELSEEEKVQILSSQRFQQFFDFSSRVIERQLAEQSDMFVDYSSVGATDEKDTGKKLMLSRIFTDEKWSKGRAVTDIDNCDQYPELIAVSYEPNPFAPLDPVGVVQVWNNRFKRTTAEYTFYCQSCVTSVAFAKFHPNLIFGGCYSGQICMWDNRVMRKTPVNKSPLSSQTHTYPVLSMAVVGSQNAHNLISVSTDGKLCSWCVDNLNQPIDVIDLAWNKKQITCTSISFLLDDVNNFVVGSEEGNVYTANRRSNKGGVNNSFEGHGGPVTCVDGHKVSSNGVDFSHLFLSCSFDWTVKLWSAKEKKCLSSFEKHVDYVMDVAWSPVNPAIFTSADASGNLFLWNLNEDMEAPVTQLRNEEATGIRKVMWLQNGHQLAVGDESGNLMIYDVHESLTDCRLTDCANLARTLRNKSLASGDKELYESIEKHDSATASLASGGTAGVLAGRQHW